MKVEKSSPTDPIEGIIQISKMDPTVLSSEENVIIKVAE